MSAPEGAPPDELPLTKEFVAAYQEITAAARRAISELAEIERATFNRGDGGVMASKRAEELRNLHTELAEAVSAGDRLLKAQFDAYHVRRAVATK